MEYFVGEKSIVRQIWGKADTILFIFAGASAEFALNKAVDWLFYTGKLPQDPLGRLFSTVAYARKIVFSEKQAAIAAINTINTIHQGVETKRRSQIPDWAYRDVLFMLIDYSIRAFELMERPLLENEKVEVFKVFSEVGSRMRIRGLPENFEVYEKMRINHLENHLKYGDSTKKLYCQYRKSLGRMRYRLLIETQSLILPEVVRKLLKLRDLSVMRLLIPLYKISRKLGMDHWLRSLILPGKFKKEINTMDFAPG